MQSCVITSALSSSSCSSIKSAVGSSSSVGFPDGCAGYSVLVVRQRGKMGNATPLRADRKVFFSERLGRTCDGSLVVRADGTGGGGSLDEKLKDLNSEKAVEDMQGFDRSARLMVENLKPVEHAGTTSPRDLELQAEEMAFRSDESVGKEPVLEVASDSAVDPEHADEHTVATADELAPEVGRSVEDLTTILGDAAEKASSRDAELLKTDTKEGGGEWEGGVGQVVDVSKDSGVAGEEERGGTEVKSRELTREEASGRILDIAREGFEVLRWAAEGVMAAGANSREGLEVVKEIIDKRVKSFNIAAQETKEVSAQLSEVAKKKYEEMQGSAAKFNEELQVQIEDKKAADELKPDSETSPVARVTQGVQATIDVATKEDGPLSKLGQTLQENVAKLSKAGQELASDSSSQSAAEQAKQDSARLVPVGENEGFFQDLAPASGSSPEPGDRSTEASDILGEESTSEEAAVPVGRKKGAGFFGDLPVDRSTSSTDNDREQETSTTSGNASASKGEEDQEYEGFFGDIPVDHSSSPSKADIEETSTKPASSESQTSTISVDASSTMRNEYEHEVGNDQLKDKQQSGQEAYTSDAAKQHDPASVRPSVEGRDEMGIGPDE